MTYTYIHLGQTKLICCCSDSLVAFWGQQKKLNQVKGSTGGIHRANLPHVLLYCKIAGPDTYLLLSVQGGCQILLTKICFTSLEMTFAELFLHLSEDDKCVGESHVAEVTSTDRGSGSSGGAEVDLTASIALCKKFSV